MKIDDLIEILQAIKRTDAIRSKIATALYILQKAELQCSVSKELEASKECQEILKEILELISYNRYILQKDDE